MPTYDLTARFEREFRRLKPEQRTAAKAMLRLFLAGLRTGGFDPRLRVHRVRKARGVWEITWAPDGRATFEYGDELHPGESHIHWRRIGDHDILKEP